MATVAEKIRLLPPGERFCLFEFFPPKTDAGFRNLLARLHRMLALNPLFVSVTWGAGGLTAEKSLDLAAMCQNDVGITTVLHLTCTNTNKSVIDHALARAKDAGIRNILALRGDPPRTKEYWTPDCDFGGAADLVRYIREQYGDYFCIGVAGYAEGHVDGADTSSQDPHRDLPYLVEKVSAGADFVITQLFFDVDKFVAYEAMVRATPELRDTILIPGLMPISTYKVFTRATKLSHALVPSDVMHRLEAACTDDDMVKQIGVEVVSDIVARVAAQTLVRGFHFYTLNLEKAVAQVVAQLPVLHKPEGHRSTSGAGGRLGVDLGGSGFASADSAIDSDDDDQPPPTHARRRSSVNDNAVASAADARRTLVSKALAKDKRTLVDISTGKGALGKDATWDEFPNGRFGDSNSPAYGEIDGYGPSLKILPQQAVVTWGEPRTVADVARVFVAYLSDRIDALPWELGGLSPETALIQEQLFDMNNRGWFTLASQPAVDGCASSDSIFGWGPSNGRLFQKSFVEFFIPKKEWSAMAARLAGDVASQNITYFVGDSTGHIELTVPGLRHKSAVTWGVFPSKEVLQPTVIDSESFRAWNDDAFGLWLEWARCYPRDSPAYSLLTGVHDDYCLVSMVHHNFKDEGALWRVLLD